MGKGRMAGPSSDSKTPRREAPPRPWSCARLSSLLVCSKCGGNYVQYGGIDYVCSGFHNGSTSSNSTRFRIASIERVVVEALKVDFLSSAALHRAADGSSAVRRTWRHQCAQVGRPE